MRLLGLGVVDHVVITEQRLSNRDLGCRQCGLYVVRLLVSSGCGVASVVSRGDFGFNLVVVDQFGTRNVHAPGLAVRVNGGFVFFAANGHDNLVARFDVFTNRTGNGDITARLFLVDNVVARDRINLDLGFGWRDVYTVRLLVSCGRGVASLVSRGDLGFNLVVVNQFGTRNIHVPGLAVWVNSRFVFFAADSHNNLVARFDVFTNRTSNSYITFRLFLIDDAVFSNGIDGDFSFWRQSVDRSCVFAAVTWGTNFVGVAAVRHFDGDFAFVVRWGNQRTGPGLGIFIVWCQTFDTTAAGNHDIFDIKAKWHFSKCEGNRAVIIDLDRNRGRNQGAGFLFACTAVTAQAHVFNSGHARTWIFQRQGTGSFHNADQTGKAAATAFATTGQDRSGRIKLGKWVIAGFQSGQHSRNGWIVGIGQGGCNRVYIRFCNIAAHQEGAVVRNSHGRAARNF